MVNCAFMDDMRTLTIEMNICDVCMVMKPVLEFKTAGVYLQISLLEHVNDRVSSELSCKQCLLPYYQHFLLWV